MTSPAFVQVVDVRNLLKLEPAATSNYSDDTIRSNIYAASEFLEKATGRYFANRTNVTLTLTSNGDFGVSLPGVRSVTSVSRAGTVLTADQTYWLLPDEQQSGVYTGLQFQAYTGRGPWWKAIPEWFDRNLDSPYNPANYGSGGGSLPNDVVMVADVGYLDANIPEMLRLVTKTLAGALTLYGPAVLTGALTTQEGSTLATTAWELVEQFKRDWSLGNLVAVSV